MIKAEIDSRVFVKGRNITKFPVSIEEPASKLILDKPVRVHYVTNLPDGIGGYTCESRRHYNMLINSNHPKKTMQEKNWLPILRILTLGTLKSIPPWSWRTYETPESPALRYR